MSRLAFPGPSVCPSSSPKSQGSCLLAGPAWQYCPVCGSAHLLPTVRVSLWQPSFPFRSLSGRCPSPLPFPSYLVVGTSFWQPWLYRSRSAVFQLVFHENCSTYFFFLMFVGGGELYVLLLYHLSLSSAVINFLKYCGLCSVGRFFSLIVLNRKWYCKILMFWALCKNNCW